MPTTCNRYVSGLMPRCGTTWWARVHGSHGGRELSQAHDSLRTVDRTLLDARTALGLLVPPGVWYARLWLHVMARRKRPWVDAAIAYGNGSERFDAFLVGATRPSTVKDWPADYPIEVVWHPEGATFRDLAEAGMGLWSWAATQRYADRSGVWLVDAFVGGDLEDAAEELWGVRPTLPRTNTRAEQGKPVGMPDDYRDWYRPEDIARIERADGWLMALAGCSTFDPDRSVTWLRADARAVA